MHGQQNNKYMLFYAVAHLVSLLCMDKIISITSSQLTFIQDFSSLNNVTRNYWQIT